MLNLKIFQTIKIRKIARKMLSFIGSRQYKELNQVHFNLIGDSSSARYKEHNENELSEQLCFRSSTKSGIMNLFKQHFEKIPVFMPSNKLRIMWSIIQFLTIMIANYFILLQIATGLPRESLMDSTIFTLIEVMIFLDIIIEGNTAYYKFGQCETQRYKVTFKYIKNNFLQDFGLFLIYTLAYRVNHWISLIFLVKFSKIRNTYKMIHEILNLDFKIYNYLQLTKLLITILFTAHVFACIWVLEARFQNSITWIEKRGLADEHWNIQVTKIL